MEETVTKIEPTNKEFAATLEKMRKGEATWPNH